ncbi:RNA polymerase sigma factor [Candidatus Poribacteria bacterium]
MEDAELVRLCQDGDMTAFEQLFHRHQDRVYSVAIRMMNNPEDALDMTQEIFLRAYQKISKFKFTSAFSTWLYRLATNLCIDELRKRKRSANTTPLEEAISQSDGNTPEDDAISKDREKRIWQAINSLKEKERAIIVLRDIEGLSYKEIAEVFGCSLGRVKSRIHEARQKLKDILETETDLWTY